MPDRSSNIECFFFYFKYFNNYLHFTEGSFGSSNKSNWVITPIVRKPYGSTVLANLRDSELAKSSVALETAKIIAFGFWI